MPWVFTVSTSMFSVLALNSLFISDIWGFLFLLYWVLPLLLLLGFIFFQINGMRGSIHVSSIGHFTRNSGLI